MLRSKARSSVRLRRPANAPLAIETLEDRCLPSATLPLDLAGLDGDNLFSDSIFSSSPSSAFNDSILKALAALQGSSGLAGTASAPTTQNEIASTPSTPTASHAASAPSAPVEAPSAAGATLVVNTLADESNHTDSTLSLREAISVVNSGSTAGLSAGELAQISGTPGAGSTITFAPSLTGSIALQSALPALGVSMNITGNYGSLVSVDGGGFVQPFTINAGVTANLSNFTIAHGGDFATGGGAIHASTGSTLVLNGMTLNQNTSNTGGGAVFVDKFSSFTAFNTTFTGNIAAANTETYGGALSTRNDSVQLTNSTFTGNVVKGSIMGGPGSGAAYGGAWYDYGSNASVQGCLFTGNQATTVLGYQAGDRAFSGAIMAINDNLTVTQCAITNNSSEAFVGGLFWSDQAVAGHQLSMSDCTITGNTAGDVVGGVATYSSAGLGTITRCLIDSNTAVGGGGGYFGGNAVVDATTISNNIASLAAGAVFSASSAGTSAKLINSTVSGNIANDGTLFGNPISGKGAGIYNQGSLSIINSTVAYNVTSGKGGGIYNYKGTLNIISSTIAKNSAGTSGGGIFNFDANPGGLPVLTLDNTIVALNTVAGAPNDIVGTVSGTPHNNLIGNAATAGGITATNGNLIGVDPLLGPLGYHGGPTATMIPQVGSPAINAGNSAFALDPVNPLTTDQRGFARVSGGTIDIGAVEVQPAGFATTLIAQSPPLETAGSNVPITLSIEDDFGNLVTNYTGTVSVVDLGTFQVLSTYTFTAANAGQTTIFVPTAGLTAGPQNLVVLDQANNLFAPVSLTLVEGGAFFTDASNQLFVVSEDGTITNTGAFATRIAAGVDDQGHAECFFTDGNNQVYRYQNGVITNTGAYATRLVAGQGEAAFTDGNNQIYLYQDSTGQVTQTPAFALNLVGGFGANGSQFVFSDGINQLYVMDGTGTSTFTGAFATRFTEGQDLEGNVEVWFTDGNNQIYRYDQGVNTQSPAFATKIAGSTGMVYLLDGNNQIYYMNEQFQATQTIGFSTALASAGSNSTAFFLDGNGELYEFLPTGTFTGLGVNPKLFAAF